MTESICADITCKLADKGSVTILEFGTADVNEICNKEKAVPEEWITKDGSDIGDEFIAYARPLIQGSVEVPMKDGLPYFAFRK